MSDNFSVADFVKALKKVLDEHGFSGMKANSDKSYIGYKNRKDESSGYEVRGFEFINKESRRIEMKIKEGGKTK